VFGLVGATARRDRGESRGWERADVPSSSSSHASFPANLSFPPGWSASGWNPSDWNAPDPSSAWTSSHESHSAWQSASNYSNSNRGGGGGGGGAGFLSLNGSRKMLSSSLTFFTWRDMVDEFVRSYSSIPRRMSLVALPVELVPKDKEEEGRKVVGKE